jgi:hypothetical protein
VRAARYGLRAADGAPHVEAEAPPLRRALPEPLGLLRGSGTAVSLHFALPAGTPASAAAAGEVCAYAARLALAPRRRGASVRFSLDCDALAALLAAPRAPVPRPPPPWAAAAAPGNVLPWARAPAPPAPCVTVLALGEPTEDAALHRFALCQRTGLPAPCVARGAAEAAGGASVVVWALLTMGGGGDGGGGGAGGAPRPCVHVLRYAEGVPLLRNAEQCALTRGVVEGVAWGAGFGFNLEPLVPQRGGGGGEGGGARLPARAATALLGRHPAALSAAAAATPAPDSAAVDGAGAYVAGAAVAGFPPAPWDCLRLLVDARAGGGAGGALTFGDFTKTHLVEGAGEEALAGGGATLAAAAAGAAAAAVAALRSQLPPGDAFAPAEEQQRSLLLRVYLPGVVAALEGAVARSGGASALRAGAALIAGAPPGAPGQGDALPGALSALLRRKLGAFAAAALGAAAPGARPSPPAAGGGSPAAAQAEADALWDAEDEMLARAAGAAARAAARAAR